MATKQLSLRDLGITFVRRHKGISEYRLDSNDLKVVLVPIPTSRVVAVVQHVNVGSRHEGAGNTGYSHLLEHLLFKGTPTHNVELGNSYDQFVKKLGNQCNATTWFDRTNYYAKIPAAYLGEYLEYEADRLRNAYITDEDLATEMPVVVDEFDIGENEPESVLDKLMNATMYTEHPYKVDTIGAKSEVLKVTAASLRERLYEAYYWPNNTALIIVGGFDELEALEQVAAKYAGIPRSPQPIPVAYTVEPKQYGERRFVIEKPGELPIVAFGYHIPEARHADSYALSALARILGGGSSSRLYKKLVDKGLASEVSAYAQHLHDPGFLKVTVKLAGEASPQQIERIVTREIERLANRPVTKEELEVCKDENRSGTIISQSDPLRWAQAISEEEAIADWVWGVNYDDNFDRVTAEDIVRCARTYLGRQNRTVGYFLPTEPADEHSVAASTAAAPALPEPAEAAEQAPDAPMSNRGPQATQGIAQCIERHVLDNGLKVLMLPTERESAVGVSLITSAGTYCAPAGQGILAQLVAEMLPEGSAKYSKAKIAKLSARFGTNLDFQDSTFSTSLTNLVPPAHLDKYLELLADVVQHPTFSEAEFAVLKTTLAADLAEDGNNPDWRAMTELARARYAPESPHHRPTAEELQKQLAASTVEDLKAFHRSHYTPRGATLVLVGKFDTGKLLKALTSKFGGWHGDEPMPVSGSAPQAQLDQTRFNVQIDGKDNLTIVCGVPADISLASPDLLAAQLANLCLGGDTLTSRLGLEIREKRGLTYGVTCSFADLNRAGAPWIVSMTTNGAKLEQAIPLIHEVVGKFTDEGISAEELAAEKDSMVNSFAMRLDTPAGIAGTIASWSFAGRDLCQLDEYEQLVRALTADDVNAAARRYFRVDKLATVVAGNLPHGLKAS